MQKIVRTNKQIQQIAVYKANTQKETTFLQTDSEQPEQKIMEEIPFTIESKE